ncbi:5666_t:CDS:2 [Ambispora gerdemannii]|uniref:5666_t:CDS:1 n=1 Tax=Ambispora gerdemannii TaxID=144530 RepID=A0A9N9C7N1_9GLOM|nr:5666_t:CDS:2 [Ambispora gerdemannii]
MKKALILFAFIIAFAFTATAQNGKSFGKFGNAPPGGNFGKTPPGGNFAANPPANSDADFAKDSLSGGANGQVCNVSKIKTKTNGIQLKNGGQSCADTQLGEIPDVNQMVSSIISEPGSGQVLKANTPFTVSVTTLNLALGNFDDPNTEYYKFSQQLNNQGLIKGHQHVTIQQLKSNTSPPDPKVVAFFKGLNDKGDGKTLSTEVTTGLPAGDHRICTMSSSFAHQPLIMPVAQRGAQDDCIRVTVV